MVRTVISSRLSTFPAHLILLSKQASRLYINIAGRVLAQSLEQEDLSLRLLVLQGAGFRHVQIVSLLLCSHGQ